MRRALLVAAVVLAPYSQAAAEDSPNNRQLIASMPDAIESVLLLQAEPLLREGCALKSELQGFLAVIDEATPGMSAPASDLLSSVGNNNLDRIVFSELVKRRPTKRLVGGAGFQPPQDIGIGSFRYLTVWITRESNSPIKKKIDTHDGIVGDVARTTKDGLDSYSSPIEIRWSSSPEQGPAKTSICVAFASEHVALVAFSADDIAHIANLLNSKTPTIPVRWQKAASGLDVDSPVVILRKFTQSEQCIVKRDPDDPNRAEPRNVPIDGFGLTSDAGSSVKFKLHVITSQPNDAEVYFYGGCFYAGFDPAQWKWTKKTDADGFTADVQLDEKEGRNHLGSLIVITLFGISLMI